MFQSTLPRRERRLLRSLGYSERKFQSTLPRRERPDPLLPFSDHTTVSIHAPTQGATTLPGYFPVRSVRFNPRSHAGSDTIGRQTVLQLFSFNPRSHAGSDHKGLEKIQNASICFNPRSHAGSDTIGANLIPESFVSIHAPTQGATAISAKNLFRFSAEIDKLSF